MVAINKVELNGQNVYQLICENLEVYVCPEDGMNIYRICYGTTKVVDIDPIRYKNKALYGMPILYPTPNRVRGNTFNYDGRKFLAQTHGIVKQVPFEVVETNLDNKTAYISARLSFEEGTDLYEYFPFVSFLEIKIAVCKDKIIYEYQVANKDNKELPYGFAVHPFFQNATGCVQIQTKAKKVMDMSEEKLPTGVCLDISNTKFDLSNPRLVTKLNLDHVYTGLDKSVASIYYHDFLINLRASEDFSHLVVYTPQEQPYFCIENQTCSTDAHNLYHKGFKEESGLIIIKPGEKKAGQIYMEFLKH